MKTKTQKVLPKTMAGTVHAQYVRCGKKNCKCAGGELHGEYFYHFVRINGRLKKRYLRADEVDQVRLACHNRRESESEQRDKARKSMIELRQIADDLRSARRIFEQLLEV